MGISYNYSQFLTKLDPLNSTFSEPFDEKAFSFANQFVIGRVSTEDPSQLQGARYRLAREIHTYVMNILNDSNFQSEPARFMADWKERRGTTEEFCHPEDSARIFFDTIVLPELEKRANSVPSPFSKPFAEQAM